MQFRMQCLWCGKRQVQISNLKKKGFFSLFNATKCLLGHMLICLFLFFTKPSTFLWFPLGCLLHFSSPNFQDVNWYVMQCSLKLGTPQSWPNSKMRSNAWRSKVDHQLRKSHWIKGGTLLVEIKCLTYFLKNIFYDICSTYFVRKSGLRWRSTFDILSRLSEFPSLSMSCSKTQNFLWENNIKERFQIWFLIIFINNEL